MAVNKFRRAYAVTQTPQLYERNLLKLLLYSDMVLSKSLGDDPHIPLKVAH